jgi:hypothetical protein
MKGNLRTAVLGLALATISPGMTQWAQATPVIGQDGTGMSALTGTMVKVVRHKKSDKDPLANYGAGFYIMVFNKSGQPLAIGPDNVMVRDREGRTLNPLTDARLAELREQQAQRSQMFGAMVGLMSSMAANSAASNMSNAVAANNLAALGQMTAMTIAVVSENNAQAILAGTDALIASYDAVPFTTTTLPPMSSAGGRILIEGMKDRDPAQVIVTINGETHEIDFAKGGH